MHGKDTHFSLEDAAGTTLRNISPYLDNVDFKRAKDSHDNTTFGAESHSYAGGLKDGTISISGLWDKTADVGTHVVLTSLLGTDVPVGFEYGPEGSTSGMTKLSGNCLVTDYSTSSPVADLVKFTAELQISGDVTAGTFA